MPPPLQQDARRGNPAFEAWVNQDQPYSSYTFSHQMPAQLQRSLSQRKPELEQVLEIPQVGENPGDFLSRNGITGAATTPISITPSPVAMHSSTPTRHRLSRQSFNNLQIPSTPTTTSLTDATTLTSNMSRQNSLFNEPLVESIEMMKFDSNNSFSTDINNYDDSVYHVAPQYSAHQSRQSSDEEQTQLLVGAGGVSNDSQFSLSFPTAEALAQSQFHASFGEKMEKSESIESVSSTMSSSSRNKQRLQVSNIMAAARPLMPKGGYEDNSMSRVNSSQSMTRLDSKDGSQDKVAIEKRTYQRPKHERVFCKLCDEHPDGFRGEHELRRHNDRQHKYMVKKWVCIEPTNGQGREQPVLPLSKCKACSTQKKKYGAYYNAAAHLRRAHFKPKSKGRSKNTKVEDSQKRGGKAGGDWPPMAELKNWMKEVEEPASDFSSATQQEEDDDDDNSNDISIDEMNPTNESNFDTTFNNDPSMLAIFPSPNTQTFDNFNFDNTVQQNIDLSMNFNAGQPNFDFNSFPTMNDPAVAFFDPSSLPQVFDDQSIGVNAVNFSYDPSLSFNSSI
jgi:hypothetical protein